MVSISAKIEKQEILRKYKKLLGFINPKVSKKDKKLIRIAFDIALEAHKDMRRKTGEPYIYHPIAVAQIVSEEMGLSTTSMVCALLHDVVEDTEITIADIKRIFGKKISKIVDGLTKITKVYYQTKSIQADNFKKILLTLADDIRVILIKIADRLHNMRTLDSLTERKQLKIASETLYLYAPIANRFGLHSIKSELEDLAMKYLEHDAYQQIVNKLKKTEKDRDAYIHKFIEPIAKELNRQGFKFNIFGRTKPIHSIWNKMVKKEVQFEDVYDIFAIRIIINTPREREKGDCWQVYSIVTDCYHPNQDRLRDWISIPKSNGYESLHVTVMGPNGRWGEVQIRSDRMDEIAEKGIASHWKYKEDIPDYTMGEWLQRIRDILENPEPDSLEFLDNIKLNLFSKEIYVFTPLGDLKTLPMNATALDLAFDIHTDIGNKCIGAKVNHKLVPLNHQLNTGDQVEIITSKVQKPKKEWLNYVVTAKSKTKIKDYLKSEKRTIAEKGRKKLKRTLEQLKISFNNANINKLTKYFKQINNTDLFYNVGSANIDLKQINNLQIVGNKIRLKRTKPINDQQTIDTEIKNLLQKNADLLILGKDIKKINYDIAKCCNPLPGEEIVSINKEDKSLEVHKTKCTEAIELMSKYANKIIKTKWTKNNEISFLTGLKISGIDDVGIMYNISKIISKELKINIQSITIEGKVGKFEGKIILYVHDTKELSNLTNKLMHVQGILSIEKLEKV